MANVATFEVIPSGAALGADIAGLNLTDDIDPSALDALEQAWAEHLVLRFRGQTLDEDSLIRFSGQFGALDPAPTRPTNVPHHPTRSEINVLSNIVVDGQPIGGLGNAELVWHQDMSYKNVPPKASVLYGVTTPATGGDTLFYNLHRAYETLPPDLKATIDARSCKHDATRNSAGQLRAGFENHYANEDRPGAIHPLVIRHPRTHKKSLYLGRRPNAWIVGMSDADSDALLDQLWTHVNQGPHYWAQQWHQHDVVIWDNRFTLHRRDQLDPAQPRLMYRTQVRDSGPPLPA